MKDKKQRETESHIQKREREREGTARTPKGKHSDAENTRQREFLCAFSAMKHISCLNASINWSAATKSSTTAAVT